MNRNMGVGWKKTTKTEKHEPYISLSFDPALLIIVAERAQAEGKRAYLSLFKNSFKTEANHPDYTVPMPGWLRAEMEGGGEREKGSAEVEDDIPF